MKSFIYRLELTPHYKQLEHWATETEQIVQAHFEYQKDLSARGIALLVGRTDYEMDNDDLFGLCILQVASPEIAHEIMENDPAILHRVMQAKLFPFKIVFKS